MENKRGRRVGREINDLEKRKNGRKNKKEESEEGDKNTRA